MFCNLEPDGSIQIPYEMIKSLGWDVNTSLDFKLQEDGTIIMSEKTEWNLKDFRDNLENIIERVKVTRQKHYVTYEGHRLALIPYEEYLETQKLLDFLSKEIDE
jgi:PHD/YefM family antitoxin component YafN of YafNO toxin-antitoxin module